jgi:hypothetical protein
MVVDSSRLVASRRLVPDSSGWVSCAVLSIQVLERRYLTYVRGFKPMLHTLPPKKAPIPTHSLVNFWLHRHPGSVNFVRRMFRPLPKQQPRLLFHPFLEPPAVPWRLKTDEGGRRRRAAGRPRRLVPSIVVLCSVPRLEFLGVCAGELPDDP